jgi:predicted metalloprotease with PDZ domain
MNTATRPPSALPPTRYRIIPRDPNAHLFEVSCTVEAPDPAGQAFRLPAWIPGSYLLREFARHFVAVHATCGDAPVPLVKERKDTWRAAPCAGPLRVVADVYAFDQSVRAAYLDARRGYFNGPNVFLCPEGRAQAPCELTIEPPPGDAFAGWRVATTLPRDGAALHGFGRYRAESYDALIDHPVEMADFAWAGFEAGGVPHDIAITGRQAGDVERLSRDLARVCAWHVALFEGPDGRAPFERYLFQVTVVGEGYGGLEHRSSTSLICRRDELPRAGMTEVTEDYATLLGLASHEYFHAWNVKRIKPAAFLPYDLTQEAYTRLLWAFEGITSYYDDLALVRSGVIDAPRYLELVARTITGVLRTPGRLRQSVAESSFDAWIKFYRQDENSPNALVSYYAKGAIVALALDLVLRLRDRSLDELMRGLWQRYGRPGIGVPEDGVEALAREIGGDDLAGFFRRYVDGTEDPPLAALLADFGVALELRPSQGASDRGGKPAAGALPRASLDAKVGNDMKLVHVYAGGAAERAGLAPGDQLVALDGLKATADVLRSMLERRMPGERVTIHAFRRDELLDFAVELHAPAHDTCVLRLLQDAPSPATERRARWLGEAR